MCKNCVQYEQRGWADGYSAVGKLKNWIENCNIDHEKNNSQDDQSSEIGWDRERAWILVPIQRRYYRLFLSIGPSIDLLNRTVQKS